MVFIFRMISDEINDFLRDIAIKSDQTFFELHQLIQRNLAFDNSLMASFFTCNRNWEKEQEITLIDMSEDPPGRTMENTCIGDLIKSEKQRVLYVFDMFEERVLFMEVLKKGKEQPGKSYPEVIYSEGSPPLQFLMNDDSSFEGEKDFPDEPEDDIRFENLDDLDDI